MTFTVKRAVAVVHPVEVVYPDNSNPRLHQLGDVPPGSLEQRSARLRTQVDDPLGDQQLTLAARQRQGGLGLLLGDLDVLPLDPRRQGEPGPR